MRTPTEKLDEAFYKVANVARLSKHASFGELNLGNEPADFADFFQLLKLVKAVDAFLQTTCISSSLLEVDEQG